MKITQIALAVATSAAISGSAMASWVPNGSGGNVNFSGYIAPTEKVTPWVVKTNAGISGLDTTAVAGATNTESFSLPGKSILGIRTTGTFNGTQGIDPQISFGSSVLELNGGAGAGILTIEAKNGDTQERLGSLVIPVFAGAELSWTNQPNDPHSGGHYGLVASGAGQAFYGGLPTSADKAASDALNTIAAIDSEITANFTRLGFQENVSTGSFADPAVTYNGFYGLVIPNGSTARVWFDRAYDGSGKINWVAPLTVAVSYQ